MGNNIRDLRRRIRSVKSTQQITRAMKLVAASKLRRAQEAMEQARPFAAGIRQLLANVAASAGDAAHPLMERRGGNRVLMVVITADRGLAGAFNANVVRGALRELRESGRDVTLQLVGRKGRDYFRKRPFPVRGQQVDVFRKLDYSVSRAITADLVKAFLEEGFDEVWLLSNRFKSVMAQDLVLEKLLPAGAPAASTGDVQAQADYIYEPDPETLLAAIVARSIETIVHQALLESYASEMGARMVAMENATKNAADMIERLTLVMNRTRQAAITTEIIEVVSGASALGTD